MLFEARIDLEAIDIDEHLAGVLKKDEGDKMARIAVNRAAIPAIGRAFGEAATDPEKRAALVKDPVGYLRAAGVSEESLEGVNLVVHEDTDDTVHLVLPETVDARRLKANDHEYLKMLGTMAVLGCMRPLS